MSFLHGRIVSNLQFLFFNKFNKEIYMKTIKDLEGFEEICSEEMSIHFGGFSESGVYCDGSTLRKDEEQIRQQECEYLQKRNEPIGGVSAK